MSEPSLELQKLLYARMTGSAALTALCPIANIFDRSTTPEAFPCIVIGEGMTAYADQFDSFHHTVFANVDIWSASSDLAETQSIAGAIREAVLAEPWTISGGWRLSSVKVTNTRLIRDREGGSAHCHGIMTIQGIILP